LNVTDEFTKEALSIDVRRSITADDTVVNADRKSEHLLTRTR